MQIKPLYRYVRHDGGVTVSPNKPDCEYTEMYRLIADEGMILQKGDELTPCVDTDSTEGWEEIIDVDGEFVVNPDYEEFVPSEE